MTDVAPPRRPGEWRAADRRFAVVLFLLGAVQLATESEFALQLTPRTPFARLQWGAGALARRWRDARSDELRAEIAALEGDFDEALAALRAEYPDRGFSSSHPSLLPLHVRLCWCKDELADIAAGRPMSRMSGSLRLNELISWNRRRVRPLFTRTTLQAIAANEAQVVVTLEMVWKAQSELAASGVIDTDGDGVGEFGTLRELAGAVATRTSAEGSTLGGQVLTPRIPAPLGTLDDVGTAALSGYRFKILLPRRRGLAARERATVTTNTLTRTVDPDLAEGTWCCYAWPIRVDRTGFTTFFVNESGVVVACNESPDLMRSGPRPGDALSAASPGGSETLTGEVANDARGRDGNFWAPVSRVGYSSSRRPER